MLDIIIDFIFWFFISCIIAIILSTVGFLCSLIIFRKSENKIRKIILATSLPAATTIVYSFIFYLELLLCSTIFQTDPGVGDYGRSDINDHYSLIEKDYVGWTLEGDGTTLVSNIEEILVHDDKIVVSSQIRLLQPDTLYYKLYEVDVKEPRPMVIDSAYTEQAVWDKYIHKNNIDSSEINTCYNYYSKNRTHIYIFFIIIDCLVCIYVIRRICIQFFKQITYGFIQVKNHLETGI